MPLPTTPPSCPCNSMPAASFPPLAIPLSKSTTRQTVTTGIAVPASPVSAWRVMESKASPRAPLLPPPPSRSCASETVILSKGGVTASSACGAVDDDSLSLVYSLYHQLRSIRDDEEEQYDVFSSFSLFEYICHFKIYAHDLKSPAPSSTCVYSRHKPPPRFWHHHRNHKDPRSYEMKPERGRNPTTSTSMTIVSVPMQEGKRRLSPPQQSHHPSYFVCTANRILL